MTIKTTKKKITAKPSKTDQKLTFLEHFRELKRRLMIVAVSVFAFGTGAYFIQHQIVGFLLAPAEGQKLIYTSPGGGLDFLFRVCIYTGLICSLPVIIYNIIKYLEPVMKNGSARFAGAGSAISAVLAVAGMIVGYYLGLPATLHFLFHQFSPASEISPLIAVQSYMSFVSLYMFGAALIFQIPLLLIFINRFTRINPRALLKHERWFILGAVVLAVLMNPTPNIIDQLMLAGPMIVMYNVGIVIIYFMNRPRYSRRVDSLLKEDSKIQAERRSRLNDATIIWQQAAGLAMHPVASLSVPVKPFQANIVSAALTPDEELDEKLYKIEIEDEEVTPKPTKVKIRKTAIRGKTDELTTKLKPAKHATNKSLIKHPAVLQVQGSAEASSQNHSVDSITPPPPQKPVIEMTTRPRPLPHAPAITRITPVRSRKYVDSLSGSTNRVHRISVV